MWFMASRAVAWMAAWVSVVPDERLLVWVER